MQFDEKQYNRLLLWANDRLRKWNIENLAGIDIIHEAIVIAGNCVDFDEIRQHAEKIMNDEVRHVLSVERLINNQVIVTTVRKELFVVETKRCSLCKKVKEADEFVMVKGRYQHSYCNSCRGEYLKRYKLKISLQKKEYKVIDMATGKKYYTLSQACKDLGLKYTTVQNYFYNKKGYKNKTTLKAL